MRTPMSPWPLLVIAAMSMSWPSQSPAATASTRTHSIMANQSAETFFDGTVLDLARAINRSDTEAIRQLSPQVEINGIYRQGMTLLFYALTNKKHAAVTALIRSGANPNQPDKDLGSPLDVAVQAKESLSLASIIDAGVSPNATNSWGTPLLFTAACLDSPANLELLVARKADLDATDKFLGRTAVYEAVSKGCYDQAIYLIEHGAKVDITTANGVTLAYSVEWDLQHYQSGAPEFEKLRTIQRLMRERGITFPADPPPIVRARMKAKGLKVAK